MLPIKLNSVRPYGTRNCASVVIRSDASDIRESSSQRAATAEGEAFRQKPMEAALESSLSADISGQIPGFSGTRIPLSRFPGLQISSAGVLTTNASNDWYRAHYPAMNGMLLESTPEGLLKGLGQLSSLVSSGRQCKVPLNPMIWSYPSTMVLPQT